ncbi:transposase [Arachnia propionica]|uniref:Transposase n=1 Tax=Arachnia propionica TaxID=1750 RepID=A0A3P1T2B2_9ACTN|nr:transposase [Arachnia propionica]
MSRGEDPEGPGGRPRASDRAALEGIVFVLSTGCRWCDLQPQMGCGSGVICWRRLRHWHDADVWERLHQTILDELGQRDAICWERHCIDAVSVRARGFPPTASSGGHASASPCAPVPPSLRRGAVPDRCVRARTGALRRGASHAEVDLSAVVGHTQVTHHHLAAVVRMRGAMLLTPGQVFATSCPEVVHLGAVGA